MGEETLMQQPTSVRHRVVLVDYEGGLRSYTAAKLGEFGLKIEQTDLGEDGVDLALTGNYDMVIAASDLADISSYEIVRRLRGAGWRAPILVLTGCTDPDWQAKLYELGADGIIEQPFNGSLMVARVLAHLRRWSVLGARPPKARDNTMARAIRARDWRPGDGMLV